MNSSNLTDSVNPILVLIYSYGPIIAIFVFVIGLIANGFLIFIFADRFFRKITYNLMLMSCISSMITLICLLLLYVQTTISLLGYHQLTTACKIVSYTAAINYSISIYNLCLIAVDRYFVVVQRQVQYYQRHKRHIIIVSEVMLWIIAIVLNWPITLYIGIHPQQGALCDFLYMDLSVSIYLISMTILSYMIPSIIITSLYWRIIRYQRSYVRPGYSNQQQRQRQQQEKRKFNNMLISVALSFILSTWPLYITFIGLAITQKTIIIIQQENLIQFLFAFLALMATNSISIITPFLYFKFDRNIRQRALKILNLEKSFTASRHLSTVVTSVSGKT